MGLEVATYIDGLVITNPVGATDPKSQGDDHIRLLKSTIKATFPNLSGAMTATHTELNYLDGLTGVTGSGNLVASASPTLTGTIAAASQTLSGTLGVTGTSTFTGAATFNAVTAGTSAGVTLSSASPGILFNETDAGSNEKIWRMYCNGDTFNLDTRTDAGGAGATALYITRVGTTTTEAGLTATDIYLTGTLGVSGAAQFDSTLGVTGAATLNGDLTISKASPFAVITATTATDALVQFGTNSSVRGYVGAPGVNGNLIAGSTVGDIGIRAVSGGLLFSGDNGTTAHFALSSAGLLTTPNASAQEVGYKGLPLNNQNGSYTCVLADAGKYVQAITTAGTTLTIPANASVAYPVGTVLTFGNITGGNVSIAVTSDSLALAGTGTTGTRTLAHNGVASALKVTSTAWIISGAGLT